MEAHEQRQADGDVRITGEVGIYLQAVGEESHQILESGEQHGIVEYPVYEIYSQIVAQYYLFEQSVENPEYGHSEQRSAQAVFAVKLWNEVAGLYDRSCYELGEE